MILSCSPDFRTLLVARDARATDVHDGRFGEVVDLEALLRGVPVTCLGMPFYAGRGLTRSVAAVVSSEG